MKKRLVTIVLPVILGLGALVFSACELPLDTITLWPDTTLVSGQVFLDSTTFKVKDATTEVDVFGTNTLTGNGALQITVDEPDGTQAKQYPFTSSDPSSYNWSLPAKDGTWTVTVQGDSNITGSFNMTAQYY